MKKRMIIIGISVFAALFMFNSQLLAKDDTGKGLAAGVEEVVETAKGVAEVASQKGADLIKDAEALFDRGELEDFKRVVEIYEQALKNDPDNFDFNWKCARACRHYGDLAQKTEAEGWKDICAQYGKKGMEYASKAIELEPDKANGYYYYGLCAGTYSDGVGLFTALKEGLKNKTQDNLEKAYEINKNFEHGGPIVAIGRFWQMVPWPYNDKDKAMEYYREFQKTEYFKTETGVSARIYMAELLMDKRGKEPKEEAQKLLAEAISITDKPYWKKQATQMLDEL